MSILGPISATEARFRQRDEMRESNLGAIRRREILTIAANTPELVRQRMQRLHADPDFVLSLKHNGVAFDPQGPGRCPQQFPRALERVLDTNDLMGMRFFEQGLQVSRAVGRIHIRDSGGDTLGYGTGFLVSSRLLLTNQHVLPSAAAARRSTVEFNYQENANGAIQASTMVTLAPQELFLSDEQLDYALVAVAPEPGLAAFGWLPLIEDPGKLLVGETVNIIQHPNGEPKQLAIRNNQVVDELELFIHYQTDTDPGSSGSPVFNDQWEVVALHHSGVPRRNPANELLTTDGRVWQEWMGEQRIAWLANEGVRVSQLVRHIRAQPLPATAEPLRQELLAGAPATSPISPLAAGVGLTAAAGTATWTIPLQLNLSVSLGGAAGMVAGVAGDPQQELLGLFGRQPAIATGTSSAPAPASAPGASAPAAFRLEALERSGFNWQAAQAVERQARAWGFADCRFMDVRAAQGFLASTASLVLVSFCGREHRRLAEQPEAAVPGGGGAGAGARPLLGAVQRPARAAGGAAAGASQPADPGDGPQPRRRDRAAGGRHLGSGAPAAGGVHLRPAGGGPAGSGHHHRPTPGGPPPSPGERRQHRGAGATGLPPQRPSAAVR